MNVIGLYSGLDNNISYIIGLFFSGGVSIIFLPKSTDFGSIINTGETALT